MVVEFHIMMLFAGKRLGLQPLLGLERGAGPRKRLHQGQRPILRILCGIFERLMFIFSMQDDCVIFEVKVNADAPHGVSWDRCDPISNIQPLTDL